MGKPKEPGTNPGWPSLPYEEWKDTYDTVHMWTQLVGKIRMKLAPLVNHWWNVTLFVTPRGLSTSTIPYRQEPLQIDFDFHDHRLITQSSRGESRSFELGPYSVAEFYRKTMQAVRELGIDVKIWTTPVEVETRIPFENDDLHASYDPVYVHRFWQVLLQSARVMEKFRSRFIGKASPVHFYWGGFDLAASRFSGRTAPVHPGSPNVGKEVMEEAYSHEVSSCGFWPGAGLGEPAYYAYTYPEPEGFKDYKVQPKEAYYHPMLREYILPYDAVRKADNPDEALMAFLQSTYVAGAELGKWDRGAIERGING